MKGLCGALVLAYALTACGQGASTSSEPFTPEVIAEIAHLNLSTVRRWTDYYGTKPVTITEQTAQSVDGSWSDTLLTVNGKNLAELSTAAEIKEFTTLQRLLEGGAGKYAVKGRDFRIRDWNAFDANYDWNLISSSALVAGRAVHVADVWPMLHDRPHYTVWVDQETLVTLKCLEFSPSGELTSEMEVLAVDWSPDLSSTALKPELSFTSVDLQQLSSAVSFKTFQVGYVPAGFHLDSVKLGSLGGQSVLTESFSDGLIELSFTQYAEPDPQPLPAGIAPDAAVSVHSNYLGLMARTFFSLEGTRLHVNAKLTTDELMNVIESITPNS